jgi:transcriptional regulator with XRE-family HTH domain
VSIGRSIISGMGDIVEQVGWNIRILREERGLSQEELEKLAGLHRAYIGQIERGEKNIGLKNLERIAKALDVETRWLLDVP